MNKFIIAFAALAVVGAVSAKPSANNPFHVFPDNRAEYAKLSTDNRIFRDFCIDARDHASSWIGGINLGAELFELIADAYTHSVGEVSMEAVQAATEAGQLIEEDASKAKGTLNNFADTFKKVISGEFEQKISKLQQQYPREEIADMVGKICNGAVTRLEPKINAVWATETRDLAMRIRCNAKTIKETKWRNLGCVTASRLNLVFNACRTFQVVRPLLKI